MFPTAQTVVFEQSGKLIYLGGNGLNCEVEIDHSLAAMTCRNGAIKSLWPAGMDNKDSRMAMRLNPKQVYWASSLTPSGAMTGAPYCVIDPNHWVFAETDLARRSVWYREFAHALSGRRLGPRNRLNAPLFNRAIAFVGPWDEC